MKIEIEKIYNIDLKFEEPVGIRLFFSKKYDDYVTSLKIYRGQNGKSVLLLEKDFGDSKSTNAFIVDDKEIITIK